MPKTCVAPQAVSVSTTMSDASRSPVAGVVWEVYVKVKHKVKKGDKLSPVLLVQGEPLWVADGYHRICASYHLDEKVMVPCQIIGRTG